MICDYLKLIKLVCEVESEQGIEFGNVFNSLQRK